MNSITNNVPSLASSALLVSLNISVYEGRKKDKGVEEEIAAQKGARSSRAASVHKHLFSNCPELEAIKTLRGKARIWLNNNTIPWDDSGTRLLPAVRYFEVSNDAGTMAQEFDALVRRFEATYSLTISKQAFELGSMFNRDEYPRVEDIAGKFSFNFSVRPLPLAGDFRVDIGNEGMKELQERYEREMAASAQRAQDGIVERIREMVERWTERMSAVLAFDETAVEEKKEYDDDGNCIKVEIIKPRRPKLHDSMLDAGLEMCQWLRDINITNDPKIDEARIKMEKALLPVDMKSLKESEEMQRSTLKKMEEIKDLFDW